MAVDEIIGKMYNEIHKIGYEEQAEWIKPVVYKPKKRLPERRHGRRLKES